MTLRSPKKRPITAPTSSRPTPIRECRAARSLCKRALLLASLAASTLAASALVTDTASAQQPASTTQPGWNLRWRKSSQVTPQPVHVPDHDVFARPANPRVTPQAGGVNPRPTTPAPMAGKVVPVGYDQPRRNASGGVRLRQSQNVQILNAFDRASASRSIQHAGHTQPQTPASQSAPVGNYQRQAPSTGPAHRSANRLARPNDFFNNPFAETAPRGTEARTVTAPLSAPKIAQTPSQQTGPSFAPPNGLRNDAPSAAASPGMQLPDQFATPPTEIIPAPSNPKASTPKAGDAQALPAPEVPSQTPPAEGPSTEPQDSMRDLLQDNSNQLPDSVTERGSTPPATSQPSDQPPSSPSDRDQFDELLMENPFDLNRQGEADDPQTDSATMDPTRPPSSGETSMIRTNELTCDEFRERIARETIDRISLDPSPPFRPDLFDPKAFQRQQEKFERRQKSRVWRSVDGRVLGTGKFVDLAYENVIIETDRGTRQQVPVNRLGEGDLGYISENWGLPRECLLEQVAYTPRSWKPMTMTWKASNLCSKTRYFEEVNLERYGHTAGPWLQPVVSSAHFFANIAVLPYKMGIHPPTECQYALGYYRPGNCAPWIVPPVPISARGALSQAAFMTGAFWLIP